MNYPEFIVLLLTLCGCLIGVLQWLDPILGKRAECRKKYYEVYRKSSNLLKPKDLLKERPYDHKYLKRDIDNSLEISFSNNTNTLLIGQSLSGKTHAIYYLIAGNKKRCTVSLLRCNEFEIEKFHAPFSFYKKVVLIDDLQRFVSKRNFFFILEYFREHDWQIIATCRSGVEFVQVKNSFSKENKELSSFFEGQFEIEEISNEIGKGIAEENNKDWGKIEFDGNIGSIFMPLSEMRTRYGKLSPDLKIILGEIKTLYACDLFEGNIIFNISWLNHLLSTIELHKTDNEILLLLRELRDSEFIKINSNENQFFMVDVYIEKIIPDQIDSLQSLPSIIKAFRSVPDALFLYGNSSYQKGLNNLEKANYEKSAIQSYRAALEIRTKERFPMQFAMTQNNLGNAYRTLAEVEDKAKNCKLAIQAFQAALEIYTQERFPMQLATTQNNLGNAYNTLAEVEDKAKNCKLAIQAFQAALEVRTQDRFPMDFAMTQNNLGTAYSTLAEVEDKAKNCKLAIQAYQAALEIYTQERFPMQFAMTQNNLGTAYGTLAEVEDKVYNCKLAIQAFQAALEVYTQDRFPMQYKEIASNLDHLLDSGLCK